MSGIEVVDLYKSYGRTRALNGLSFTVKPGEIYGLIGPNGAGKTTTLKILVGLLRPDRGAARIFGVDVTRSRVEALRMVGYIPENPVCFQNLTVREFLEFIGALRGLSREDVEDGIGRYLALFNMEDKAGSLIGTLSRGMVQKVLASAAFLVKPRALIMDEPMAGMDPESQHAFKEEVRRMAGGGAAVLISSHLLDMVERFCTRVGVIERGRLVAEDTVYGLKKRYEAGDTSLEEVFLRIVGER